MRPGNSSGYVTNCSFPDDRHARLRLRINPVISLSGGGGKTAVITALDYYDENIRA